ncbi:hypothetical protein FKG94_12100 [Exilibacterium tricleocarpae]|uniref:Uncharacterized protein n=1 Tax=Exilibacterium tricleocarpae TaxID=2591008 RepID=A0A545TNF6_9GAMM|nr:hypothetical protein [Exilibacterium tricleocarpae]TQV78757.1 hypothetical protein FKG94_12100 [Exilibacterium tricleocarpae]
MRSLAILFLVLPLLGCNGSDDDDNDNGVKALRIDASGVTEPVDLIERLSGRLFEIDENGEHLVSLDRNQDFFDLAILYNAQGSGCRLTASDRQRAEEWRLQCDFDITCLPNAEPVCAKQALPDNDLFTFRYRSFENSCRAYEASAMVAFSGTGCGDLNNTTVPDLHEPVFVAALADIEVDTEPHTVVSASIDGDIARLVFEVRGGCGEHDFDLVIDDDFTSGGTVRTSSLSVYGEDNDGCTDLIDVPKRFDLTPVKEIYKRQFPNAVGNQTVVIRNIGNYRFRLD